MYEVLVVHFYFVGRKLKFCFYRTRNNVAAVTLVFLPSLGWRGEIITKEKY